MQCAWFPFTYEQKLASNDKRMDISKKGYKAIHVKEIIYHGKKLAAQGYNTGMGKVVLSMLTAYQKWVFNFDLRYPRDVKWYYDDSLHHNDRFLKGFTPFRHKSLGTYLSSADRHIIIHDYLYRMATSVYRSGED